MLIFLIFDFSMYFIFYPSIPFRPFSYNPPTLVNLLKLYCYTHNFHFHSWRKIISDLFRSFLNKIILFSKRLSTGLDSFFFPLFLSQKKNYNSAWCYWALLLQLLKNQKCSGYWLNFKPGVQSQHGGCTYTLERVGCIIHLYDLSIYGWGNHIDWFWVFCELWQIWIHICHLSHFTSSLFRPLKG